MRLPRLVVLGALDIWKRQMMSASRSIYTDMESAENNHMVRRFRR